MLTSMTKDSLRKTMGRNIRSEREARNLTIEAFAENLDLSSGFIGLIERGCRGVTPFNLYKISEIYGIPIDKMFEINDDIAELREERELTEDEKRELREEEKRDKITILLNSMSEMELDYVLTLIREFKQVMKKSKPDTPKTMKKNK